MIEHRKMELRVIGDDIFANGERVASFNTDCKNATLMTAFRRAMISYSEQRLYI